MKIIFIGKKTSKPKSFTKYHKEANAGERKASKTKEER